MQMDNFVPYKVINRIKEIKIAYLGRSTDGFGVRDRFVFTASGSETSLSGADDNSRTLKYEDGTYVDVFMNGVLLLRGTDYNTNTTNTISGLASLAANDIVEIIVYDVFTVADTVSKTNGGSFGGEVTFEFDHHYDRSRFILQEQQVQLK